MDGIITTTNAHARNQYVANLKFLERIGYSNINALDDDDSAFFYESGPMIDADGVYHAYHPDGSVTYPLQHR